MLGKFRSLIETAAWEGTRTKIMTDIDGISRIGTHLSTIFQDTSLATPHSSSASSSTSSSTTLIQPGSRILVLTSPTAGKRGTIVPHYLRKSGYIPLLCELPDHAPIANNVTAAVDVMRRVGGASMIIAYGSSAIQHIGRATACIATNGKVKDYATNMGGKTIPVKPSLPFLSIPSCPTSNECLRESLLLWEGQGLSSIQTVSRSVQSVLLDPKIMVSLDGLPAVNTSFSTLIHAIEGYLRTDSDRITRQYCWLAIQLCLQTIPRILVDPKGDMDGRLGLAFASTLVSLALTKGSLGPCRGIGMTIASRYRIPYSNVLTAIAPEVLSSIAGSLEETLEEAADNAREENEDDDNNNEGNQIKWRDNFDENDAKIIQQRQRWNPSTTKFMQRPTVNPSRRGTTGGMKRSRSTNNDTVGKTDDLIDDAALDRKLTTLAQMIDSDISSRLTDNDHAEINEVVLMGKRFQHIIYLLEKYKAFFDIPRKITTVSGLPSIDKSLAMITTEIPSNETIKSVPLSRLSPLLYELRDYICKGIGGVPVPSLVKDYGLSDNELRNISTKAEIDDALLNYPISLKSSDILDMLKHS